MQQQNKEPEEPNEAKRDLNLEIQTGDRRSNDGEAYQEEGQRGDDQREGHFVNPNQKENERP